MNGLLAFWVLFRAGLTVIEGTTNLLYGEGLVPALPALDSNLRFLGGVGIGLALLLLWITPNIEKQTVLFRAVWGCRFVGGLGRLLSTAIVGAPPAAMLAFTVSEVFVIPPLIYWQAQVASSASRVTTKAV